MSRSRCTSLLLLALLACFASGAAPRPVKTQTSFAVFGCPHVQEGSWDFGPPNSAYNGGNWSYEEATAFILDYVCDLGVEAVIPVGDLTLGGDVIEDAPDPAERFPGWFRARMPANVELWPVAGNHDVINFNDPTTQGSRPYSALQDSFPDLFRGKTWWTKTIGAIRFIALNNNDGYTYWHSGGHSQAYYENNPPYSVDGDDPPNPDFSGISDRSSEQYRWFKKMLQKRGYLTTICMAHRGIYAPQDSAETPRRANYPMRTKACALACSLGVDCWLSADMHIAYGTKRIKSTAAGVETVQPADSLGIHYFGACGTYARRSTDSAFLPVGSLIAMNSSAIDSSTACRWVYVHYFKITGNRIYWRFLRTAQGPGPTYALRVVNVTDPRVFYAN